MFLDGPSETSEEHVQRETTRCNISDARLPSTDTVCCFLVEEETVGVDICGDTVPRYDLVLYLLHSLREGCCEKVFWSLSRLTC